LWVSTLKSFIVINSLEVLVLVLQSLVKKGKNESTQGSLSTGNLHDFAVIQAKSSQRKPFSERLIYTKKLSGIPQSPIELLKNRYKSRDRAHAFHWPHFKWRDFSNTAHGAENWLQTHRLLGVKNNETKQNTNNRLNFDR